MKGCKPFEILNLGKHERQYWQGVTFGEPGQSLTEPALYAYLAPIQLLDLQPAHLGLFLFLASTVTLYTSAALAGRAREVTDAALRQVVRARVLTERDGKVWPSFDEDVIFELGIERALLTLTQADGQFPAGPTIWTAGDGPGG